MAKVMRLVKRRPEMEVAAFRDQWTAAYAELAGRDGLQRCVLNLTRLGAYRGGEPAYDGVAELWFDEEDAVAAFRERAQSGSCRPGANEIVDTTASIPWVPVDDVVVHDGAVPEGAVKSVVVVHPKPGLGTEEFHRYWTDVHGPIGAKIPHLSRYVQCHARETATAPDGRPVEGFAKTWFPDTAAMRDSSQSPEWDAVREDEPNFIDDDCPWVLTDEIVVFGG